MNEAAQINKARNKSWPQMGRKNEVYEMKQMSFMIVLVVCVIALAMQTVPVQAYDVTGWTPIYAGIDYATGYATSPRLMRSWALRVDTQNPNVQFYASHDNGGSAYETGLQGTDAFVTEHGLKVACNGAFYNPSLSPNTDIWGLLASNGTIVSPPDYAAPFNTYISFTSGRVPTFGSGNSVPPGCYNAIGGAEVLLWQGANQGWDSDPQPATCFGLSQDNRYFYMVCIDGRQPGWSDGSTPYNTAQWMLSYGAYNAIKMDGGGSTCMVRQDVGVCNSQCYGYVRQVGANFGVSSASFANPPYLFSGGMDGWGPGNAVSGFSWSGGAWNGSIYFDQTGADGFIVSGPTGFNGPYAPQCINVDLYPQSGNSALHDMQLYWKTTADPTWTSGKSSAVENYTAQNAWTAVNLDCDKAAWWGQTINQLRLDVDSTSHGTRFIINHMLKQGALFYSFAGDTNGWTQGNGVAAPWWTNCCGWPGILVVDQTGNDSNIYGPVIPAGGDWPYGYRGGVNDKIHVRVYPQNGSTSSHDMRVYWLTDVDGNWSESKSVGVNYTAPNNAWYDVNIPVGTSGYWPRNRITQLRLDFDSVNHGNRWIVDYIRTDY